MKPFTLEVIRDYQLFYILKKLNGNARRIVLSHQQSHTNAVVEDYELFRMADNSVLVAFTNAFKIHNNYNYVASDGITEEIVQLQSFERIQPHYKLGPEIHQTGTFVFCNSVVPKSEGDDWRCDNQKYGPKTFTPVREDNRFIKTLQEIEIYEPIFSINGVGHLVYIKQVNRSEDADEILNNSFTPFSCYTLAEAIKLTLEWASVNNDVFQNYEDIAVKANKLVTRIGITNALVANQPDMQVYEFLKGNDNARHRPDGVQAMSEELDKFIQNNVAHLTLSNLIALNPTAWDLAEVLEYETVYARQEWDSALEKYHVEPKEYGDVSGVCEYIAVEKPGTLGFVKLFFTLLNKKKELLEGLA